MTRVGFVGVGHLGSHLAASVLRAGFPLVVHDLDRRACEQLVGRGARWAGSPREVAEATDVVITCLPSPAALTAVVSGPDGLLAGLPGRRDVDRHEHERPPRAASASPRSPPSMAVVALEAPVTGGVHQAAAGEITVLVGGDEEAFSLPTGCSGRSAARSSIIGPLGSASTMKVITNILAFVHLVAAGEALMLARRGGLDLAQAFEVIKASSGNSFVHETESQLILTAATTSASRWTSHSRISASPASSATSSASRSSSGTLVEEIFARGARAPTAATRGRRWS